MVKVTVPQLGEGIGEVAVSFWHFQNRDKIKKGEDLVEVATDKATFNIPSPVSGIIIDILVQEGQTAKVADVLALIEEDVDSSL